MFTANITVSVSGQVAGSYLYSTTAAAGLRKSLFEQIPAGSTTQVDFDLDVSEVKLLAIRPEVAMTIKVNSLASPSNIFQLEANQSFVWPQGDVAMKDTAGNLVTSDISSLHVVNSTSAAGSLRIDALVDPTPAVVILAPSITSATMASGVVGSAFSYQIAADNAPASYGAIGLPSGLSIDVQTGQITGTPSVDGDTTVTISATNNGGTGSASLVISIAP